MLETNAAMQGGKSNLSQKTCTGEVRLGMAFVESARYKKHEVGTGRKRGLGGEARQTCTGALRGPVSRSLRQAGRIGSHPSCTLDKWAASPRSIVKVGGPLLSGLTICSKDRLFLRKAILDLLQFLNNSLIENRVQLNIAEQRLFLA